MSVRYRLVKLEGRCGNCEQALSLDWSYCPFCGAHWTVLEPTMTVRSVRATEEAVTPRTVNIVCAKASAKVPCVPAVRGLTEAGLLEGAEALLHPVSVSPWRCSFCGARVRVVA